MKYVLKEDGLIISEITEAEKDEIKGLLADLSEMDSQAPQITKKVVGDLEGGKFDFRTLIQFSKWCHTAVRYSGPKLVAQEISSLMFGKLIPRLCDQQNKVLSCHIEQLNNFLVSLKKEGTVADPDGNI